MKTKGKSSRALKVTIAGLASASLVLGIMAPTALASSAAHSSSPSKVLTYVVSPNGPFVDDFNPWSPANPVIGTIFTEVYEPLFYYNQYTGASVPKLATSYSYANGHKTIVINLRHGVKWSDGQPFTSRDVVYTLHMLATTPSVDQNGLNTMISSVEANGLYQVKVNLKSASNLAWFYIGEDTPIVPAHIWSKENPATFPDANPVTTGPFVFGSVSNSLITFKRNPHYWNAPEPYVSEIQMPLYLDNNTAALAMAQGNFDAATNFVPSIQTTLINRNPQHYHYWFPPIGAVVLETNDAVYPISLTPFRQAVSDAIDRQKVSSLGEFGYESVGNSVGLPEDKANQTYISKAVEAAHPLVYNPTAAKKILRKAGFTWNKSGQLVDPRHHVVTLSIDVSAGTTDWIADAGVIADNLEALGINAQVKTPSGSTLNSMFANGSFQMALNWVDQNPAYIGYNQVLNSAFSAPIGKSAVVNGNYERWINKPTDALLNEYPKVFSLSQQQAIMSKLENIFAANLPVIPLLNGVAWEEYNTTSFTGWPSPSNPDGSFAGAIDDMYIFASVKPVH